MEEERPLNVLFYQSSSGQEPVREWLKGLDSEDRRVIGEDIKTAQFGWPLGLPLVKKSDIKGLADKARPILGNASWFYQKNTKDTSPRSRVG